MKKNNQRTARPRMPSASTRSGLQAAGREKVSDWSGLVERFRFELWLPIRLVRIFVIILILFPFSMRGGVGQKPSNPEIYF
jgi:hypothetical protein